MNNSIVIQKGVAIALASLIASSALAANVGSKSTTGSGMRRTDAKRAYRRDDTNTIRRRDQIQSSASSPSSSSTTVKTGTSTTTAPKALRKKTFVDNLRASVLFEYYGSSVADPLSGQQTDKENGYGISNTPSELDTRVTFGYALNDNLTLSYNAYFFTHAESVEGPREGFNFRPAQSFLRLTVGSFAQSGKLRWNGDFRAYPGLGVHGTRLPLYLRTGQNLSYAVNKRFSIANYSTFRYYHRSPSAYNIDRDPSGNQTMFRFTIAPTLEYQVADTVGLALSYNNYYGYAFNNGKWDEMSVLTGDKSVGGYFELGASIDIGKQINLNPYIDTYTNAPYIEASQIGANLNINIL